MKELWACNAICIHWLGRARS